LMVVTERQAGRSKKLVETSIPKLSEQEPSRDLPTALMEDRRTPLMPGTNLPLTAMRVVLLYKRDIQPDENLLKLLEAKFIEHGNQVFIDRHMAIGVEWAREIERQIWNSDAVIPLLSAYSISSEMLAYEIQIAHEAARKQNGKPHILPIRIKYQGPLPAPLAAILVGTTRSEFHS